MYHGLTIPLILHNLLDAVQHAGVVVHAGYGNIALDLTIRIASVGCCLSYFAAVMRKRARMQARI